MKNSMGMSVSERVFTERFNEKATEDVFTKTFQIGDMRGKINGNNFYFYISEDGPRSFMTILKGKFDSKSVEYSFTRHNYTKVLMLSATVLWIIFSVIMVLMQGPVWFLGIIIVPVMLLPYFMMGKKEKKSLETVLARLCKL